VPISDDLRPFLDNLPDGILFKDRDGKYWTSSKVRNWRVRKFQPAAVKAGLGTITKHEGKRSYKGIRIYDLRVTRLSMMLYEGTDPVRVAQVGGHSTAVLYSTYARLAENWTP
jgi:hypothetical protein